MWTGKIIGLVIGILIWGPLGLVIGLFLGHLYDIGIFDRILGNFRLLHGSSTHSNVQKIFFNCTFTTMGYIAKSDGRVSEQEIRATKAVMTQMGLSPQMKQEAIRLFTLGKQPDFNPTAPLDELKHACRHHPALLRTFLEIQLQIVQADTSLTTAKRAAIQNVCQQLGIEAHIYNEYERRQRAGHNYQRHSQTGSSDHYEDAYNILGVSKNDSDADIKRAYRRLMSKHHPDKLIAEGVPPEMVKLATQKTQQIKEAYETIKTKRGL